MKYKPEIVLAYFKAQGLPRPELEYKFHPIRKWRFDFAFVDHKVFVEVNGGIWIAGGHSRGAQMKKDWEKWNAASSMGWRGIWCEPKDLLTIDNVAAIKYAINFGETTNVKTN